MAGRKVFISSNLGVRVITACCVVLAMLLVSNIYFLNNTGSLADKLRENQEKKLVQHEIENQVAIMAMDQAEISQWSGTIEALAGEKIDTDFVNRDIVNWMWPDFGIQTSIIVAKDNSSRVAVFEENWLKPEIGEAVIAQNIDLIEEARQRYHTYLESQTIPGSAFAGNRDPIRSDYPLYAWSIRPYNGVHAFVMAMAIAPHDDMPMILEKDPDIYLTFKPFFPMDEAEVGAKLEVENFHFTVENRLSGAAAFEDQSGALILAHMSDDKAIAARWSSGMPSRTIWQETLPVLIIALMLATLLLAAITWRFGRVVKALQKSEEKNRFLAFHDALTGLPNRLQFDHELEDIIADGKQDRCAILCMDLDRFKTVNDAFGHQAGDVVLKTISERISNHVGDKGMAARIGGDEFIILLHDRLDRDSVLFLCDQLIENVCIPIDVPGGTAEVGASIGVAWWPDDAITVKSIIRTADEALYWSKENGRGQVSCASRLRRTADHPLTSDCKENINLLRDELVATG